MTELLDVKTEPTGWMSPTGEIGEGAPEVVKTLLEAKKWNNVEQLATGYTELEKFTGTGEHLLIPKDGDAEGWDKVYSQLGRPETHDKYVIEDDKDVPLDDELANKWKQFAQKEGYTQKQMAGAVQFQRDIIKDIMKAEVNQQAEVATTKATAETAAAADKEKYIETLKQKWGGEVGYKDRLTQARRTADNLGIYQTLEAKGLASDPEIINMLDIINSRTAEGVITLSTPPPPNKTAEVELAEIQKSESFIKEFDPKHKETMARYHELCQIISHTPGYKPRSR